MFMAFFRIGLFTFGGGYAMLPMLEKEIVEKYQWATHEELLDYFAIAQGTPGIIAVNTATFIGTKYRGFIGCIVTTLGVVFPSWIIITIIAVFYERFKDLVWINSAFEGIRVVVIALIFSSIYKMSKKAILYWFDWLIAGVACATVFVFHISPVIVLLGSLVLFSIVLALRGGRTWR
jgi:chromate transporter